MKNICLLDLNYTLVGNQADTRMLRPFSRRMEAEEYRADLIEAIRDDYVIIVTARPDYQMKQTMANIKRKTGWQPQEWYFNDINAEPKLYKCTPLNCNLIILCWHSSFIKLYITYWRLHRQFDSFIESLKEANESI